MSEEKTYINPLEDQRREALRHYEELSSKCHHWSSFIANAIKAYNLTPAPVSVKTVEDENETLSALTELVRLKRIKDTSEGVDDYFRNKDAGGEHAFKVVGKSLSSLPPAPVKPVEGETITGVEGAAKEYVKQFSIPDQPIRSDIQRNHARVHFIEGAKWQAQQAKQPNQ